MMKITVKKNLKQINFKNTTNKIPKLFKKKINTVVMK